MFPDFRATMTWLHTWVGVILGSIMFVMFFMGTLSVFKAEIDLWMLPQARLDPPKTDVSADVLYDAVTEQFGEKLESVRIIMPSEHFPAAFIYAYPEGGEIRSLLLDPNTMKLQAPVDSAAARSFLYPMHYRLIPLPYGRWFSAAASMFLLLMMVSGVVIHRKIFVDFFTFRPKRKLPRSLLDLHNLTSVLAMPFHIMITLTGVIILYNLYFLPSLKAVYPDAERPRLEIRHDLEGTYRETPTGNPNPDRIASIDEMVAQAEHYWGGETLSDVYVAYPHDQGGVVRLFKSLANQVSTHDEPIQFSASTGQILTTPQTTVAYTAQQWLSGAHMIFFDHWVLRWFYFFAGIAGCIMIATGFLYWIETRRKTYQRNNVPGLRIVEGLAVWSVMGLMTATAAYFVVNRTFVPGLWSWHGILKPYLEVYIFYLVWISTLFHGLIRCKAAWGEQAWILGFLAAGAVVLNWTTTGDHLLKTLRSGDFAIAGMDLILLLSAVISILSAHKIGERRRHSLMRETAPKDGDPVSE